MEKVEETLSLGVSIILSEICEQLLTKSIRREDGTLTLVDRDLPFRLRYRLTRNKVALDKDVEFFNKQRLIYLAQYGEPTEDGTNVVIKDPQKMELFKQRVQVLFDTEVTHNIIKLEEEDIDQVRDIDINLSSDALGIFIGYMTNDQALLDDLGKDITINPTFKSFKPEEASTPVIEKVETPEVIVDPVVEEKPIQIIEAPKAKKTKKKTDPIELIEPATEEIKLETPTKPVEEAPKKTPAKSQKKRANAEEGMVVLDDMEVSKAEAPKPKKTTATKKTTTTKKTTAKTVTKKTEE